MLKRPRNALVTPPVVLLQLLHGHLGMWPACVCRRSNTNVLYGTQVRHSEFLAEHLGEWPGPIVDQDTGGVLGYHRGFWFHTIGQRKGVSSLVATYKMPVRTRALSSRPVSHSFSEQQSDRCCSCIEIMCTCEAHVVWPQIPLHGGPWYCVRKDARMNTVYVSRRYFSAEKTRDKFRCANLGWWSHNRGGPATVCGIVCASVRPCHLLIRANGRPTADWR